MAVAGIKTPSLVNLGKSGKKIHRVSRAYQHNGAIILCISGLVAQNPLDALPVFSGGGTGVAAARCTTRQTVL